MAVRTIASLGGGAFTVRITLDDATWRITRVDWACLRGTGTLELLTDTKTLGTKVVLAGESGGRNVPPGYNRPTIKGVSVQDEARLHTSWVP